MYGLCRFSFSLQSTTVSTAGGAYITSLRQDFRELSCYGRTNGLSRSIFDGGSLSTRVQCY